MKYNYIFYSSFSKNDINFRITLLYKFLYLTLFGLS